jgi:hypothetical protein
MRTTKVCTAETRRAAKVSAAAHVHSATAEVATAHGVPTSTSAAATTTSAASSRRRVRRARQHGGQRDHGEDPDNWHGTLGHSPRARNGTASKQVV